MLVEILDLPLIYMGFRVNSCELSDFIKVGFKDALKMSFEILFFYSHYEMDCEMGVFLIQMLY